MHDGDIFPDELDDAACMRVLAVILEVGTALARECKTPSPDSSLADRCKSYDRISLALRPEIHQACRPNPVPLTGEGWVRVGPPSQPSPPASG